MEENRLSKVSCIDLFDERYVASDALAQSEVISPVIDQSWLVDGQLGQLKCLDISLNLTFDLHVEEHRSWVGS